MVGIKRMNKAEIIIAIINVFDKLESLENSVNKSAPKNDSNIEILSLSNVEKTLLNIGKEKTLETLINNWDREVRINTDEGNKIPQSYQNWLSNKLNKNAVPVVLSQSELLDYLEEDIKAIYDKNCKVALSKVSD